MDYYFNNFKFNSQNLVLTKDNQPLAIRNNEAKLLAFFLANPGQVYSKDAILENVWAGKVVSEQAVFQAISNLRTLFGEDAIKTFPKKGYQWQIPLHSGELTIAVGESIPVVQPQKQSYWLLVLCGVLCIVALIFFFAQKTIPSTKPISILLGPFTQDGDQTESANIAGQLQESLIEQINQHAALAAHEIPNGDQPHQVAAAPGYFLERYQQSTGAALLVTGRVRQYEQTSYLSWTIQGRSNQWRGYLTGQNPEELAHKLAQLLNKVAPIKVLWEASDWRLINAQLHILHSENPDDLATHCHLIESLLYLGDINSVKIQAEELEQRAQQQGSAPYQALALLMQMYAGFQSVPAEQRLVLLDRSVAHAESIHDRVLQSYLMERYAPLYYELKNFTALEDKLVRALALAESYPEQRLQVLRTLSVFSFKFHHEEKRDDYLQQARAILDKYQLPADVYAQLDDLAGIYTNDNHQKEHFFRAAVDRFKPEDEVWIKDMTQRHLVDLYIDEKRWADALAVLATETNLSGAELFMQAQVYFKQNEMVKAQAHAEAAFKKANLQGEYFASLESALLLAQIHKQTGNPDLQKSMHEFVEKNAFDAWKKDSQKLLDELR